MTQPDLQFAKTRWMVNTIENCAIQVCVTRYGDLETAAGQIAAILRRAHNEIRELAGSACPSGWEADNGYCFPCTDKQRLTFTGVLAPGPWQMPR